MVLEGVTMDTEGYDKDPPSVWHEGGEPVGESHTRSVKDCRQRNIARQ